MAAPSIARWEDRNLVGLCHLDVVEVDDVESVPAELSGNVADDVVLVEGASWSRVYLEDAGGLFQERWQLRDGDQYAEAVISGAVARDRLALMPDLWAMKGRRYLVIFTTKNGDQLLMGRKETPAMALVGERKSGDAEQMQSDRNQYVIAFTLTRRLPVPFYQGEPPEPDPGGGGGGEVLIRNAADDETLATVTAPDSYVLPAIRIPYVDAAGDPQYFLVYVDSIVSGELTVTEPGGGAPPVPRFVVRTTDTATVVGYRDLVSPTMDLVESKIRYKDEANATQELDPSDTEFDGTHLRPATIIGRGTMRNSAGTGFNFVTAADLVANTVPNAPDVTYQRVDSASTAIGSPVAAPAGTTPNITCPDGTVANKASSPTYTLAVKSNSTEVLPKVRVQLRDGSTVDYDYLPTPTVIHTEQAVANVTRTYTAGDTWSKPAGLKELLVLAVGAGGGGGSGRRGAASSQRSAGGGGGGGAMVWRRIPAASLASTETVTIGAGGTGGAAQTADSTNGNAGTLGGDTSFGSLVVADGGGSGAAGSTGGSGTGGANGGLASACTPAYGPHAWSGQQRVTPSASTGDAGANGLNGTGAAPSGGAGGGISSANAVGAGGAGGGCYNGGSLTAGPSGGASSGGAGTAGTDNVGLRLLLDTVALAVGIGTAGSGGGASIVGAAGSGGAGGNYGAGGGGGGASLNGSNSGAGGNGAGGLVVLVEIYN